MTEIIEPTECPSCGHPLVKVNDQLFCKNSSCDAQINGKIAHMCKVLGIKGLGPKTIEKLELENPIEIYYINTDTLSNIVGDKVAAKLQEQINNSKNVPISSVIESFAIPLIGGVASKKLAKVISSIDDITEDKCKEAGLGEKATNNIMFWMENEYPEIRDILPFDIYVEEISTDDKQYQTVCITGKLKNYKKKSDAEADLLKAGYKLVESVTKNLNFLVDEEDGTSSKRLKANSYNIPIITDLNDLLRK